MSLIIKDHRIQSAKFEKGFGSSPDNSLQYVVMHYPFTDTLEGTLNGLGSGKSYHVIIDRDGTLHQLVDLNRRAFHAGVSDWKGINSLNSHAIGVSLQNAGKLKISGNKYKSGYGGIYGADQVTKARPRLPTSGSGTPPWENYTSAQLDACEAVLELLAKTYPSLKDIVGHDEIAMGRRDDPGPLFPWDRMRAYFPKSKTDYGPKLRVKPAGVTLRKGQENASGKVADLPGGTILHLRSHVYREIWVDNKLVRTERTGWIAVARENSLAHAGFIEEQFVTKV